MIIIKHVLNRDYHSIFFLAKNYLFLC